MCGPQQVLQAPLDRFDDLWQRDRRLRRKVELPHVAGSWLDLKNANAITFDDVFQSREPGVR